VGDHGFGSSWKLSGGSAWSSALTNVEKKRQVRRAISLSARASAADGAFVRTASHGRLLQRATAGDAAQSSRNGNAIGHAAGRTHTQSTAATQARLMPPPIRR